MKLEFAWRRKLVSLTLTSVPRNMVGLVPPLVKLSRPDYAQIDRIVAEVMLAVVSGQPSGY